MRKGGTLYDKIEKLPASAVPVSEYADAIGWKVGSVYMKYKRFIHGYTTSGGNPSKGSDPGYIIRCYKGMNFVIPSGN